MRRDDTSSDPSTVGTPGSAKRPSFGHATAEDLAHYRQSERDLLVRRWRLFAPLAFAMVALSEVAAFISPEFPHAPLLTSALLTWLTGLYLLARSRPSRTVMGWASALTALVAAAYIATSCAETGRFQSLQVLAVTVLISMAPGLLSLDVAESLVTLVGSVGAWFLVCRFWQTNGKPVDYTGLATSATYLVFLAVATTLAQVQNRRLRLREFLARRDAERIHRFAVEEVLFRHLPPRYVERVLSGDHPLDAPPDRRVVTVLFADLVAFSTLADGLDPATLGVLMARFYDATAAVAFEHGATIDKFIGDAVMALVGAPDPMPAEEQAQRAVEIAQQWHRAVGALTWPGTDGRQLVLRIGIHQEVVAVGAFGGKLRSDYTVLGRGVNVASRLEQRCRPGEIMVSDVVFRQLGPQPWACEDLGPLTLKGIPTPVHCHALRAAAEAPVTASDSKVG